MKTGVGKQKEEDHGGEVRQLKGYDQKKAPTPNLYDYTEHDFYSWPDLLIALMASHDNQRELFLQTIEGLDKKTIDESEAEERLRLDI